METTTDILKGSLENPLVVSNALKISMMVSDLANLVDDREIAIETVAAHLEITKDAVIVALRITQLSLSE